MASHKIMCVHQESDLAAWKTNSGTAWEMSPLKTAAALTG